MNDDINTKRTELANQMAAAGAAVLDFNGTAAALAAIPDTEPQQYVAAGTPENIAAILPATICPQRRQKHGERPSAADLEWEDAATSGDAPDLQQLKALALAYQNENGEHWYNYLQLADGISYESAADFMVKVSPAVVLGLIARIESQCLSLDAVAAALGDHYGAEAGHAMSVVRVMKAWGAEAKLGATYKGIATDAARIERAAAPTPSVTITDTDAARRYVDEWHKKHFPTDRTFTRYIMNDPARSNPLAGDFAWQLANALQAMEARAAVSAATKPTADLSSLERMRETSMGLEVHSKGDLVWFADVQSLLATKPAAAPADWREIAAQACYGQRETKDALKMPEDVAYNQAIENCMDAIRDLPDVAATPAASTTGAAQTAEQVRAKLQEICDMQAENCGDALSTHIDLIGLCDEARKILSPIPTHSSEAGDE